MEYAVKNHLRVVKEDLSEYGGSSVLKQAFNELPIDWDSNKKQKININWKEKSDGRLKACLKEYNISRHKYGREIEVLIKMCNNDLGVATILHKLVEIFRNHNKIYIKYEHLEDLGMGYETLKNKVNIIKSLPFIAWVENPEGRKAIGLAFNVEIFDAIYKGNKVPYKGFKL